MDNNKENYTEAQLMELWYEEELKEKLFTNLELREVSEDYELQPISQLHECHSR